MRDLFLILKVSRNRTVAALAVYLLPSLGSRLKKISFSTLNRRNHGRVSEGKSQLSDFPSYLTRISSKKYRFA